MTGDSELRLVDHREGIAFEHYRYQQYVNALPVEGAFVTEHVDKRTDAVVSVTDRSAKLPPTLAVQASVGAKQAVQIAEESVGLVKPRGEVDSQLVYLPLDGELRLAWKTMLPALEPLGDWLVHVDALDGKVLRTQNLIRYECTINPPSPGGCVYDPSPVVEQCSWDGLADNDDADSPLLTALRVGVELLGLQTSGNPLGQLIGDYVDLTAPGITGGYLPAGVCQEPSFVYDKTRSDDCFEEVMAYYHVDAVQRKVQTLGFTGASAIYASPIPVHAHYTDSANAFYLPDDKGLHFGDGGIDLAEDGDVIVHEYGHALLDDQVPDMWTYEGACIHEGFADVLSTLIFLEHNCDEACLGEWTDVIPTLCVRRSDSTKHYPEDMDPAPWPDPHKDGEIWSGAVWAVFQALGGDEAARDKTLTLLLEGNFFLDPLSGLRDAAGAVIAADEGLYGGADVPIIEAVFDSRGLIPPPPPPNDDFDDAIIVEPLPFSDSQDTSNATVAPDDPLTACAASYGHTAWYRMTAREDMTLNLNTFGSMYDTVLAVYTGPRGALTEEVCNDDSGSPLSSVFLSAMGGVTYHIMVASYGDEPAGALTFRSTAPPPNDDLANAVIMRYEPFWDSLSTYAATTEEGEPQPCAGIADTVWYAFTETTDQLRQAYTFSSDFDTALAVYSGPPLGLATFDDLTLIDCNDNYDGSPQSEVTFATGAGITYYFQVGGYYGAVGDLAFNLAREPREALLLIKDVDPWYCTGNEQALQELGYDYHVMTASEAMASDLSQYKIVMVASDQLTSTYDTLAANQGVIEAYVDGGGVLIAHATDQGWQGGYWETSWLPGGVHHVSAYENYLSILAPAHPVVAGKPGGGPVTDAQLDEWDPSTSGYFTGLLPSTDRVIGVRVSLQNQPVYIQYPYGEGHVLATMQLLEWIWPGCWGAGKPYAVAGRNVLRNEILEAQQKAGDADVQVLDFWAEPPWVFVPDISVWWGPIPVWEVKHNNGPRDTDAYVWWWVEGGYPDSPVDVRWVAEPGDTCTFQGDPVDCVSGDPATGDIDDLHFEVWLPVSSQAELLRGIQFECKDQGVYVLTLGNYEYPVEPYVDPDPSNNLRTTPLVVVCGVPPPAADKYVESIEVDFSASDYYPGTPQFEVVASTNVPITVTSTDTNLGPSDADTEITLLTNVPPNCEGRWLAQWGDVMHEYEQYDPVYPMYQIHGPAHRDAKVPGDGDAGPLGATAESALHFQRLEAAGGPYTYTRDFELHCWEPGTYTFTFCSKAEVKPGELGTIDPYPDDNWQCYDLAVDVQPDGDGDGVPDIDDNCPDDYNPAQANTDVIVNPPGDALGDVCDPDDDNDEFDDDVEDYLGTDSLDNCPDNPSHDAWPLDNDMDTFVTVVPDILAYRERVNTTGGPPPDPMWMQRLDLNADNYITVVPDILYYRGMVNTGCT